MDIHSGKVKITKTPRPPKREPDEGRMDGGTNGVGGTLDYRWSR
jgi:hypothetical protein